MSRIPVIAGNWKMNKTVAEAKALASALVLCANESKAEVIVCVPFTDLAAVAACAKDSRLRVGAQNIAWAEKGAFTGEISAAMLLEAGATHAVVGHSERRQYFGETDATVNMRTKAAIAAGITPIVCVGETKAERESALTDSVNERQIRGAYEGIPALDAEKTVVAYEPVWAIGTGLTATDEDANAAIAFIRGILADIYGRGTADKIRILYGGSMNAKNCDGLLDMPEIDGGLIGGASLVAEDFARIIESAKRKL